MFAHFAATVGGSLDAGTGIALWIGLGLALGGAVIGVALYVLGGARPQTPDLDALPRRRGAGLVLAAAAGSVRPSSTTAHPATESAS